MKSRRKLLDETIPSIVSDLENDRLNVTTPAELCEMFKELGINIRHIQKVASHCESNHIKEIAIIEILCRKMVEIIYDGIDYQETIDTDVFDKISLNMMTQRLSELLKVPIEAITHLDFKSPDPFKDLEVPEARIKNCRWFPISVSMMIEEARKCDKKGKDVKDPFNPLKKNRSLATQYYKKACTICEKIFGEESIRMADLLLELAQQLENRHQEQGREENSRWNDSAFIPEDDYSMEGRYFYQTALLLYEKHNLEYTPKNAQCYLGLAQLHKPEAPDSDNFNKLGDRDRISNGLHKKKEEVYQYLMKVIEIHEFLLGVDHPTTKDDYAKLPPPLNSRA